ncbi:MAG: oligosaccharide flippase family protein [Lentisphaerae bacterium]|nr:oligosaccharide flippase family protein [Lentisphaerota bacterium]
MAQTPIQTSHHKHLAQGTLIGLVSTVGMGLVNLVLRRHWALTLAPADFGWFYINYTVLFFTAILIDLGGANYSTIAISKEHAAGDTEAVSHIFFSTALYKVLSGVMGTIGFWILAPWLATHFFHQEEAVDAIRLMAFFFPLFCLEGHLFAVLCSFRAFVVGYGMLLLKFMLMLMVALRCGPSIRVPPLLFIGGSGLFCLLAMSYIVGSGRVDMHLRYFSLQGVGRYLIRGLWLAIFNISAQTVLYVDQLVATMLLGATAMAVYSVAVPIVMILYALLIILPTVSIPVIAAMWGEGDSEPAIAKLCSDFVNAMLALLWLALLVTVPFGNRIIALLFSEQFVAAGALLPYLAAGMILYISGYFCFNAWNAKQRNHTTSLIMLFGPLINVGLCLWLIPKYGLRGAAIAVCCTHAVMGIAGFVLLKVKMPSFGLAPSRALYISGCGVGLLSLSLWAGPVERLVSRSAGMAISAILLYLTLIAPMILPRLIRAAR